MTASLPPIDHVARALLMSGAREDAIALMESAARRGGDDAARCSALLAAVRARPSDRTTGPAIALDAALVEALASTGLLVEALAVARGGRVAARGGHEIAAALEQVLEEPPAGVAAPSLRAWAEVVAGSVEAAVALEGAAASLEPWLRSRAVLASRLLRGFSVHAPTAAGAPAPGDAPVLPDAVRSRIAEKIATRDLPGALEAVRAARSADPSVGELVAAIARMVVATERLIEETHEQAGKASTTPLGGHGFALFQLRMGNLSEAERSFRRLVLEQAGDHVARERLADVIALRRAIDPAAPVVPAEGPIEISGATPAAVLDKKHARPSGSGWAAGRTSSPGLPGRSRTKPPVDDWDREVETSVMRPEQEAEMILRGGRPDRALEILVRLRERDPQRAGLAARIAEIEQMIEERAAPLPGEHTVQRDVSSLRSSADARGSTVPPEAPIAVPEESTSDSVALDFDEPTMIGRRPAAFEADPLAQTQSWGSNPPPRPIAALPATDDTIVAVHRIVPIG